VRILKGFIMRKLTTALLLASLAAAANVAMADDSAYASGDSELAGTAAIERGTVRSHTDAQWNDRASPDNAGIPSGDSEVAGFAAVSGGAARSFADTHQNERALLGNSVFPSEDPEVAE
jgi:hypothetical protein